VARLWPTTARTTVRPVSSRLRGRVGWGASPIGRPRDDPPPGSLRRSDLPRKRGGKDPRGQYSGHNTNRPPPTLTEVVSPPAHARQTELPKQLAALDCDEVTRPAAGAVNNSSSGAMRIGFGAACKTGGSTLEKKIRTTLIDVAQRPYPSLPSICRMAGTAQQKPVNHRPVAFRP